MDRQRAIKVSKYVSKHLRHQPHRLGLELELGGWVDVASLLQAANQAGFSISHAELVWVVAHNDKQRFAFDATGQKIRANQGHSITIDLQLAPLAPPTTLYHGTAQHWLAAILTEGLQPMRRHHVHLSSEQTTAWQVGQRHGSPVILEIAAESLAKTGVLFYRSENGIWLVEHVPPSFLTVLHT